MYPSNNYEYPSTDSLRTGNILLCRTKKGLEGKLLRFTLNSYWNHVAIVLVEHNNIYILEAKGGDRIRPILYDDWCLSLDREVKLINSTCDKNQITKYIDTSYDYQSTISFLFPKFIRDLLFNDTSRNIYCFEFICRVYGIEADLYTPQIIENNLESCYQLS